MTSIVFSFTAVPLRFFNLYDGAKNTKTHLNVMHTIRAGTDREIQLPRPVVKTGCALTLG